MQKHFYLKVFIYLPRLLTNFRHIIHKRQIYSFQKSNNNTTVNNKYHVHC